MIRQALAPSGRPIIRADDQLTGTVQVAQMPAGAMVQRSAATPYTTNTALSATIPWDDTPPLDSEGTQILSVAHAPLATGNTIVARYNGAFSLSGAQEFCYALFSSTATTALIASAQRADTSVEMYDSNLQYSYTPGATGSITYSIRVGPDATVSARMNGTSSARKFGGVAACTLIIEEVKT